MMCGIDSAVKWITENCGDLAGAELIINRLNYHRSQAEGMKPVYHKGDCIKDYYTCRNCGKRIDIIDNFCAGCGFMIKWDTVRCLTGLPLVDMTEK